MLFGPCSQDGVIEDETEWDDFASGQLKHRQEQPGSVVAEQKAVRPLKLVSNPTGAGVRIDYARRTAGGIARMMS